ncbi:hypothetical protein H6G89_29305 [Oscillatoria sp. FACHB-1407]|uniref:hypothetical protein n=1 Tax=Oscillatoria sp. FACHB-1407 TaxID=2692847 RepID=UPI001688F68F|nr:hypothetical protein [Oscillatoria sp. FACHB-1407]MBD2465108.1 hypothetical protein [Oscillatoria sp. FACHB-1407]
MNSRRLEQSPPTRAKGLNRRRQVLFWWRSTELTPKSAVLTATPLTVRCTRHPPVLLPLSYGFVYLNH